jgi:hypothetical protein
LVILKRGDRVVLGADRLLQFEQYGRVWTEETDKIRRCGAWHYSPGGYTSHPGARHDIFTLVEKAIRPHDTLREAMQALFDQLGEPVAEAFAFLHEARIEQQLDILIVGKVHPGGLLGVGQYLVEPTSTPPYFSVQASATTDDVSHSAGLAGGPAVELMVRLPRPAWLERGDVAAVRKLIRLQEQATPALVRGCDVLQVTSDDARFVLGSDDEEAA